MKTLKTRPVNDGLDRRTFFFCPELSRRVLRFLPAVWFALVRHYNDGGGGKKTEKENTPKVSFGLSF